ncbi:MAG: asparagine synthase C-terminal domain-containing protein [Promethearchaeota archaeon]
MDDDLCAQYSQRLYTLLVSAVSNCFAPSDSLGVLFSGGLDSSIITAILSKTHTDPLQLFVAGIEFAKDLDLASEAAEALNLSLTLRIFTEEDVKEALPAITSLLGPPDVMHTELAIPFFFAVQCAKQFGVTILICGQGADELFSGYAKYEKLLLQSMPEAVLAQMESDLNNLKKTTLPFLQRIVSQFSLRLVTPFLEPSIIDFSSTLPFSCKLQRNADTIIRKRVLRLLAENLGLPSQVTNAPKRAMQYGSGSHRVLTKLATEYWLDQNPELTQRQARSHARVEQYLKLLAAKNPNSQ